LTLAFSGGGNEWAVRSAAEKVEEYKRLHAAA
jgi:hypothetical protein